ncbi:MAG: hypothetical protein ACM3KE_09890 [Hyphomicrobiales bacterium]
MDPVNEIDVSNMTPRQWLLVIILNVLVLAELCISMYLAAANPEEFTETFVKAFFCMLIPTLVIGVLAKRRLGPALVKA